MAGLVPLGRHAGEALQAEEVVQAQDHVREAYCRGGDPFAARTLLTQRELQRASDVRAVWEPGVPC